MSTSSRPNMHKCVQCSSCSVLYFQHSSSCSFPILNNHVVLHSITDFVCKQCAFHKPSHMAVQTFASSITISWLVSPAPAALPTHPPHTPPRGALHFQARKKHYTPRRGALSFFNNVQEPNFDGTLLFLAVHSDTLHFSWDIFCRGAARGGLFQGEARTERDSWC